MTDMSQIAASTRDSIGRYFSLVSVVPSGMLVAWVALLIDSGAWTERPDPIAAFRVFSEIDIGGATGLALTVIFIGVVMHPMQFFFVQFLEGYGGVRPLARQARQQRTRAYRNQISRLRHRHAELGSLLSVKTTELEAATDRDRKRELDEEIAQLRSDRGELERITADYPIDPGAFMPTRLGNVLRHYEWSVGTGYGIEVIPTMPYLVSAATTADAEYLDDQRSQLDLAVRMTIVSLVATILTSIFMGRHGLWLLVALLPYTSCYLSYRGAVVAASDYGRALGVVLTMNRFALYERLQIERPLSTDVERAQNEELKHFLRHDPT
ncbi:MAG: hypothetical protein J2P19_27930, partial [Pseudonocardia sp.]|nr:hypothetical protein [Pseudonocardia sp.]